MANARFNQFMYSFHRMPVLLDCNFIVDHSNGNGLGIRSLKGQGVKNVYMNTSSTPAAGNPNPAAGYILVHLADNYNRSLSGFNSIVSPLSGSNVAIDASDALLTPGLAYVITVVGTSTAADWAAVGVPSGVTPAPGVAFIAIASGAGVGNGQVQVPATAGSNITDIETVGDPNATIAPLLQGQPQAQGSWLVLRCLKNAVIQAPADNSVISLAMLLSNSSVQVSGE